eukprot:CAMPEP_0206226768 /NCGR_PEP_ID=MMETSP0047_2-20121206/8269_1 /ASSEMBLY_ACC=CAM_ASM_000192 /TAXON_ID=195065 /ORGANISM="Chroomonas mesostigmatica_cf, Strain CCMP1168" /LENGTH=332 /DNA_ID=CAMNT_0053649881 /DNA_START=1197 /DNA_END=2195 /DNA_ORIENTATION=+
MSTNISQKVLNESDPVQVQEKEPYWAAFEAQSRIVDMTIDLCYHHVEKPWPLTICTEPMYGLGEAVAAKFWYGEPPYPRNVSLLDAFIVYHTMQGARVVIHDQDGSLGGSMRERFEGRTDAVQWSFPWRLDGVWNTTYLYQSTAFEAHSETSCMWEARFKSKLVMILHSVDNFALPWRNGTDLASVAQGIDTQTVSNLSVPTAGAAPSDFNATHPSATYSRANNILSRFNLLGGVNMHQRIRLTPMCDPRMQDSSNIHWFSGERPGHRGLWNASQVVLEGGFYTVHLMGITRPGMQARQGQAHPQWGRFGAELSARLEALSRGSLYPPPVVV